METVQSIIRELSTNDQKLLKNFLCSLSEETFACWNRFGFSIKDINPEEIAYKQCQLTGREEKGFISLSSDEEIAAYGYLRFFPDKQVKDHNASLGIVVADKYQRRGIGKELMLYMHQWAKTKGLKKIWLATYTENKAALALYKQLGYEVEGIFMYDEKGKSGWDHVVSMALLMDDNFKNSKQERKELIDEIEKYS